jgi:hypothetical protein
MRKDLHERQVLIDNRLAWQWILEARGIVEGCTLEKSVHEVSDGHLAQ